MKRRKTVKFQIEQPISVEGLHMSKRTPFGRPEARFVLDEMRRQKKTLEEVIASLMGPVTDKTLKEISRGR